ncbi:MAG TPA: hypothetical protein VGL98_15460 [Gammaproteobacteria bacterium]
MNRRANILSRMRRWKSGAGRYVVGAVAVAYLSAGAAPCAAAGRETHEVNAAVHEHVIVADQSHAAHEQRDPGAHSHHGHQAHGGAVVTHQGSPAPTDSGSRHCPHCPPGAPIDDDHSSCFALEDLTNVGAAHAKDTSQPLVPLFVPAPFTLPRPLASPRAPPPLLGAGGSPVPLNVRHCVFLI